MDLPVPDCQPARPSGYVVVANGGAGSTAEAAVAAAVARLAADAPTDLRWTGEPEECVEAVRGLMDGRRLVIAGGDGSIHLALSVLTHLGRTGEPVGLIPLGTGNDFARNHGIPLDPVAAADVVIAGRAVAVDAMAITGDADGPDDGRPRLVANNLHAGLGVRAARRASRWKPIARRLSYPLATVYEGLRAQTSDLRVTADGAVVHDGPVLAALVLLGPSMGGGVEVTPERPRRADLVVIDPAGLGERAALVGAALRSRIADAEGAHHHEVDTVTIEGADGVDVDVDGEVIRYRDRVRVERIPDAWSVLMPGG